MIKHLSQNTKKLKNILENEKNDLSIRIENAFKFLEKNNYFAASKDNKEIVKYLSELATSSNDDINLLKNNKPEVYKSALNVMINKVVDNKQPSNNETFLKPKANFFLSFIKAIKDLFKPKKDNKRDKIYSEKPVELDETPKSSKRQSIQDKKFYPGFVNLDETNIEKLKRDKAKSSSIRTH